MPLGVSTREMREHGTRLANISLNPYPIWRAQGRNATIGFWLLWFDHIPILQVAQPSSGDGCGKPTSGLSRRHHYQTPHLLSGSKEATFCHSIANVRVNSARPFRIRGNELTATGH